MNGLMVQWYNGLMVQWYNGTMVWYNGLILSIFVSYRIVSLSHCLLIALFPYRLVSFHQSLFLLVRVRFVRRCLHVVAVLFKYYSFEQVLITGSRKLVSDSFLKKKTSRVSKTLEVFFFDKK